MTIPEEIAALIREHEARPDETELYYGSEGVRLTTKTGRTIRYIPWEGAATVALHLLQERLAP